ncbi:MAG: DUF2442 domain-containing protein [Acidobacteria bacterium]|nr:MAG: DUF2442 domain-containing protein [Acidobacteriota bacterium]
MNTLTAEIHQARIEHLVVTDDSLTVELADGRTVSVPLAWYPRLLHGSIKERNRWRLIGKGEGVHWPDLDEDISVQNLLLGQSSGESQSSFKRWLDRKAQTRQSKLSREKSPSKSLHRRRQKARQR